MTTHAMADDELLFPTLLLSYGHASYNAALMEKMLHAFAAERRFELIEQGVEMKKGGWGGSDHLSDTIKKVRPHDADLFDALDQARNARNDLVHYFWLVNAERMRTHEGVEQLVEELIKHAKSFRSLARRVLLLLVEIERGKPGFTPTPLFERNVAFFLAELDESGKE